MKANQKFVEFQENDHANMIGLIIMVALGFVIVSSLITVVADNEASAKENENISGTATEELVDLWDLLYAVVPIIIVVKIIT